MKQTITLKDGWNAVYVRVGPANSVLVTFATNATAYGGFVL